MEEKHRKLPLRILSSLNKNMVYFYKMYSRRRQTACLFPHSEFVLQWYNQIKKVCQDLFVSWPNGEFQIDNSKYLSSNDYMFGQDLTLSNNHLVQIIDTILPQRAKNFVRISELRIIGRILLGCHSKCS